MPSITSYTPFETLKFCQSIVQYGVDAAAFQDIATALNASELIRESNTYDEKRFTADALHSLYEELVRQESANSPKTNGDVTSASSKKRKLSASPQPNGDNPEELVLSLVEKLYARFREETIKEIRRDEEEFVRLQEDIKELERQPQSAGVDAVIEQARPEPAAQAAGRPAIAHDGSAPGAPAPSTQSQPQPGQQPYPPPEGQNMAHVAHAQQQHMSPGPYNRPVPTPSPRPQNFQPQGVPLQHGYPPPPQGHPQGVPYGPGLHQMPPPMDYGSRKGSSSTSTPARGSPAPPHPQQYPPYQPPPYHPGSHPGNHQWPMPYPPPGAYPPHMQYPNQPYYVQSPGGRQHPHYQTPHQPPYQQYPQTAPVPYQAPHGWQPSPTHSPYPQAHSAASTPISHPHWRQTPRASGSSTPWKRKQLPPNALRPPSPTRPERGISPVSDTEDMATPLPAALQSGRGQRKEAQSKRETGQARRGRPPSIAASGRSQSVASRSSETPVVEKAEARKPATIKTEAPSTPGPDTTSAETSAAVEQRSSGRRGRPRANTTTSKSEIPRSTGTNKRKRSHADSVSPPPQVSTVTGHLNNLYPTDPSLILVSKNFAKTTQIILNEITSHKLAGVFAKPLSERDAPGYKDLVRRAQDLKSIKTAVGRGGRAAVAAIEALEDDAEGAGDASASHSRNSDEKEGQIGNGVYLVKKTEDLVPPKGIANSAQLELELMRVFANAIMFNPLPQAERGFGRNLRLRKRGGDVVSLERDDQEEDDNEDGEGGNARERDSSEEGSEESEGDADTGIIADAREMFEDVYSQVKTWRELERERQRGDGLNSASGNSEGDKVRQGSVASVAGADEAAAAAAGASTPTAAAATEKDEGRGTLRKRRKLAD